MKHTINNYVVFSQKRKVRSFHTITSIFFIFLSLTFINDGLSQTPPYPPSPVITDLTFNFATIDGRAPGSDNWTITWAADGHQYTTFGDGGGFGGTNSNGRVSLGFARIEGTKDNYQGYNVWGGKNPENNAQFTGKSYGIISIDGKLWMWRTGNGSDGSAYNLQELYRSLDYGATWQYQGVKYTSSDFSSSFPRFYAITFCQFGKDYAGARDNYVYMYAPETSSTSWNVQIPGRITLIRVNKTQLSRKSSYEYFSGTDRNGNPTWSGNLNDRAPVFKDVTNGVMRTSVSFNAGLGRYLLTTQHVDRFKKGDGHIGIYDAPEPWGPWTTVLFDSPWDIDLNNGSKTVFWNFSNKWLSGDGRDFVMVYTGPGSDQWGTIQGKFVVSGSPSPPPLPPTGLKVVTQ